MYLFLWIIVLLTFRPAEFHSDNLYYQHHSHKYNQLDGYAELRNHLCYSLLAQSKEPIFDKENHPCWKIFDHNFYAPSHPRYQPNYDPKFSISVNECRNVKTVLLFNQVVHPDIHSFSYKNTHFHETTSFHHTIPTSLQLKHLYANPPSEVNTTIGWLEFTILDLIPHPLITSEEEEDEEHKENIENIDEVALCYHGEHVTYDSKLCTMEDMDHHIRKNRTHYFGGSGYYFTMKSTNRVVLWSPVTDHGEGIYTVRIRVDDPGDYTIKLYREQVKGCHMADCDLPSIMCVPYLSHDELEQCKNTNLCMKEVTTMHVVVEDNHFWPPWKHIHRHKTAHLNKKQQSKSPSLPACPANEIGIQPGRWIDPAILLDEYSFPYSTIFGQSDWPYVWMPYDCYIPTFATKDDLHTCINSHRLAFSGLSRERTNSFDIEDLLEHPIVHKKLANAVALGDKNFYFPIYYPQINDRSRWNQDNPFLNESVTSVLYELRTRKLCTGNVQPQNSQVQSLPLGFLLNEEFIWAADTAYAKNWHEMSKDYQHQIVDFCAHDQTTFVYKTTVATANARSWERLFLATRQAAQLASTQNIPVVDAFMLTIPWIHDRSIFPDGVHLYTNVMFQGNFVSKTATMMFLRYLCPVTEAV